MTDSTMASEIEFLSRENAQLREELKKANAHFTNITEQLNDGIWDWDLSDNSVYLSPRWKEMLGYDNAELPNAFATWTSLIHPDDFAYAIKSLEDFLKSDHTFFESIHRLKHKNGRWVWILDRGVAIRNADNKPVRVFGAHTDITKLRTVEETLMQREREFNTIVSFSPDGIVTFNQENVVSSVNPAFLKMTGFTREELLKLDKTQFDQKMLDISEPTHPYQRHLTHDNSQLIWISKKDLSTELAPPHKDSLKFNFKLRHSNYRVLKMTAYLSKDASLPVIIYFRDVTLEVEMDQMKNEFLSVAAHELRMPISSIYGYSELLLMRDFDEVTRRDILQAVHGLCNNVVELINQLLDLARIEAQCSNVFEFENQPITKLIKETLDNFKIYGDFRKIEVHYFVDEFAQIYVDSDQLKRALINILSNAIKYSPNGQNVELEIRMRTNSNDCEQIGIIVKDKGIGIAKENLEHIFDKFWRADNVSDIIGSGLGMALVKEIVDLHHGEIDVQSTLGKGTTVALWFPVSHHLEEQNDDKN
ncbi:MAG: PAS domain-containing protein [Methylococcales bacterium]|nr:PAS domain-containing protein [Methylococcales bacterium]